jgi:uncharacterized membrane protein
LDNPQSTAKIGGHPLHPLLVPFPIVGFVGALLTDIVYTQALDPMWYTFSVWLLTGGLVMAGFAVIAGAIDFFSNPRIRATPPAWPHVIGNVIALVLAIINAFVHSRDGYTAVVPTGITLSALTVAVLAVTAWLGGSMIYRYGVGVRR